MAVMISSESHGLNGSARYFCPTHADYCIRRENFKHLNNTYGYVCVCAKVKQTDTDDIVIACNHIRFHLGINGSVSFSHRQSVS